MAGNKPGVKLQRTKARSSANSSPQQRQMSNDSTNVLPDLSILRKSIPTSITGFAQARDVFDTGTTELKQLLSNECDIIYECRICRNLFRSLANFISHKRVYCCEKFTPSLHPHFNNSKFMNDDIMTIIQNEEEYQDFIKNNKNSCNLKNGISTDNLGKKNSASKDLTSIIERLALRTETDKNTCNDIEFESSNKIHAKLQSIPDSKNAVYQNIFRDVVVPQNSMKDEIAELNRLISSNEAVLGPDGKLLSRNTSPESLDNCTSFPTFDLENYLNYEDNLYCNICKINFSTQKTLKFHMKHKHAENRLVYPCPDCTDTFSNSWSVFRHLFKVHRKSATHIRKLRESIQRKAFKLHIKSMSSDKNAEIPVNSITEQQRVDQENQAWFDNLEGDGDIPRCGGCGKRFERRAALSSHRQTCQLRKTAQNKLNSNVQRKIAVKSSIKGPDEPLLSEPLPKLSKIEKPLEKRIEIKIRKDYVKTSPVTVPTSSPSVADEDTAMELVDRSDAADLGYRIGESDCNFINSLDLNKTYYHDDSNTETVKDCDDANVDGIFEKSSSDTHNSNDINDDSNLVDNSEVNYEEIKRVCRKESAHYDVNKACGQKQDSLPDSNLSIVKVEYEENSSDKSLVMELDGVGNDFTIKTECSPLENQLDRQFEIDEYRCDYCDAVFTFKQRLERHIVRHLIWMKFECKICGIKSCNIAQYKRHMKHQHRNANASQASKNGTKSKNPTPEKRNFKCVVSNQSISDKSITENVNQFELSNVSVCDGSTNLPIENDDKSNLDCDSSHVMIKKYKPKVQKGIKKKRNIVKRHRDNKKKISSIQDVSDVSNSCKIKIKFPDNIRNTSSPVDENYSEINLKTDDSSSMTVLKSRPLYDKVSFEANTHKEENHYKKRHQHIASSESYTVRRPVRNRIKNFDKDFEYDSSYFPKAKVENKDISNTRNFSQKPVLKRKPFLQNEMLTAEISHLEEESPNQKEELTVQKPYQGMLQTISLRVASQGKAMMKQSQLNVIRRNTPPFIRTAYRPLIKVVEPQKIMEKFTPIDPLPTSTYGTTKKTTVPLVKATQLKFLQTPSTVLKTSERLFSEKFQRRAGTHATSHHQKSTDHPTKRESLLKPKVRKVKVVQQTSTLPTKLTSRMKLDHQALSSDNSLNSEEITMLNKSQYKKSTPEKEPNSSDNSLSILPTNSKNNSAFVNISLKQLKNLQKDKRAPINIIKNITTKNISALKNLEDNNEIKISKVQADNMSNSSESPEGKDTVEIMTTPNKNAHQKKPQKIINIKNLITSKKKFFFSQKYITSMLPQEKNVKIGSKKRKKNLKSRDTVSEEYCDSESKVDTNVITTKAIDSGEFSKYNSECSKVEFDDAHYEVMRCLMQDENLE